jgi:hypothetical protein
VVRQILSGGIPVKLEVFDDADYVARAAAAMIAGLPYTALRDAVLTHPTLVEAPTPLFSSVPSAHNIAAATTN